jgi:aspartate carbamoyltransferase catalytic subunit
MKIFLFFLIFLLVGFLKNPFYMRDVISITDFERKDLEYLFEKTDYFLNNLDKKFRILEGKIVSLAFFEPSTRTRLSFETAAKRLGADVIGFSSAEGTSVEKGENFADTIKMLEAYSDLIVVRHRFEGAARFAAEVSEDPVINGGDGKQHHPTQAMIDLYTIYKLFGHIDGLRYAVVGDLRYGRAAASFIYGLALFRPSIIYLVSPPLLKARREVIEFLKSRGVRFEEREDLGEVISDVDVVYMTRVQKERFPDPSEYEKVKGSYRLDLKLLERASKDLKILHPLPKVDEIDLEIDKTSYAAYYKQAFYGVPLRMALLTLVLSGE